ncbi:MAG: mechanosensitive ion channel family protein [Prochloraceae cyanobacterium]
MLVYSSFKERETKYQSDRRSRSASWRGQFVKRMGLVVVLLLTLMLAPAMAQSSKVAPVVLDGRQIFEVSSYEPFTAQARADTIESLLRAVVKSQKPVEIKIETRNQSPVILIDERYLLTVTQRDAGLGRTPEEEAELWAQNIRQAVEQAQKERSAQFLWRASLLAASAVLSALGLNWGLGWLWQRFGQVIAGWLHSGQVSTDAQQSWALKLFLDLTLFLARAILWVAVALYATNLFPLTRQWSYRLANSLILSFSSPLFSLGQKSYNAIDFLILIGLLLGLIVLAGTATNLLRFRVLRVTGINLGVQEAIVVVTKYTLISIGTIVLLQIWGLELSSLTILAGALSIGVGFGFQNIARNFGSGLVLIFERPIQVGDFVEVGEYMGTVEKIGARSTEIKTLDLVSIVVPNSRFLETEVINWSHRNPVSRIHVPVGVAYHSDVNLLREALLEAAKNYVGILSYPPPEVWFKGFGDSALEFELLVWINDPSRHSRIKSDLYFLIEAMLRKHQIEIPFPQRDLHLRSGSLPVGLSPQLEQALFELFSHQPTNGDGENS